jgi:hypothetical protein
MGNPAHDWGLKERLAALQRLVGRICIREAERAAARGEHLPRRSSMT